MATRTLSYKARIDYTITDVSKTTYSFPFVYLKKKFIQVYIQDAEGNMQTLTYGKDYTVDNQEVTILTTSLLALNHTLSIRRETTTDSIVTWNDGSVLLAADMTLEQVQLLHLQEEQRDYLEANTISVVETEKGSFFNANNLSISNVADPTDAQDVVTKHYMEAVQDGFVQRNQKIEANVKSMQTDVSNKQQQALASAIQADESERSSLASANLAEAWATATTSPDNIADVESTTGKTQSSRTWALFSKSKAQEANTSATNAKISETNAKTSETKASVSATTAKTSETNAKASERTASDSASASASSASAAAMSATNAKTSETKALASENNAKTSETKALASEQNAKDSETNASASAEAASSSEANALASEIHARNSEQTAVTSATNAKASETNAKNSETNASASAEAASSSEANALASEIHARNSETNAANSAKQAAESAGVFQDFTGATADTDGTGGKVPKPLAGEQEKYLKADGTWSNIDKLTTNTLWDTLHFYENNYVPSDLSNTGWNQLGFCSIYYTQNKINNQPTQYGQLINIPADKNNESTQLWIEQNGGNLFSRGGNGQNRVDDTAFKRFATLDDVGEAEKVDSQGNNWIRYNSGLQMCWNSELEASRTWTFPVPFSSSPAASAIGIPVGDEYPVSLFSQLSNTSCIVAQGGYGHYSCVLAIGRWK